jgi:integrase
VIPDPPRLAKIGLASLDSSHSGRRNPPANILACCEAHESVGPTLSESFDPTRPVTSLKTSWKNAKTKAGVDGRFHDTRHTLITELAENGEGDQTIMDIAGHVSKQMLARYSHIRMDAKRKALESVSMKPVVSSAASEASPGESGSAKG